MFGFSLSHIIILGLVVLLVGPKQVPILARKLGMWAHDFKQMFGQNLFK